MSDPRDEIIVLQRKLIAAHEREIALLRNLLNARQPPPKPLPRKDMQA